MESLYYQEGKLHKGVLIFKPDTETDALKAIKKAIRSNTGSSDPVYAEIRNAPTIKVALEAIGFDVHVDDQTYTLFQKHNNQLHQSIYYTAGYELLSQLHEKVMDGTIIEMDNGFDELYTYKIQNGCVSEEWHSIHINNDGSYEKYEYDNTQAD